ncbi:MAG: FAD-dependent oxidoreductase [Erysipelotrichaceae bacterium]|nr:FAD-dependent oxidoreductase [Erysipelotrichaceae bacterium]
MKQYKYLTAPLKIRNKVLRNRFVTLPMMPFPLTDERARPTEKFIEHFVTKAEGGAAMVTMSGCGFMPDSSTGDGTMDLFDLVNRRALFNMVERIHKAGALACVEDFPGTMQISAGYTVCGNAVIGSGYDPESMAYQGKMMTVEDMEMISDRYAEAVYQAYTLGFDALLMHFLGNDPVGQFISPVTNKRTDEFGGSIENRWRFPIMIIDKVRQRVGDNMILWLRTTGADPFEGGITVEDTIAAAKLLEGKIDILEAGRAAMPVTKAWEIVELPFINDYSADQEMHLKLANQFKAANLNMLIMYTGANQDPDKMEEVLENGYGDIIGCCRGALADANVMNKVYNHNVKDIVPCVKCLKCVDTPLEICCTVNPRYGHEFDYNNMVIPDSTIKKVAIVGGGPAGISAAIYAHDFGHQVTLYEKSDRLGGRMAFADKMEFKVSYKKYKDYLLRQLEDRKIDVRLNTEATKELLEKENYDEVIVAIGADNRAIRVEGMTDYIFASDIYENDVEVKGDVVIIGGGATGCETALYLARRDHKVTILEAIDKICGNAHVEYMRALMYPLLKEENFSYYTSTRFTKVEDGKAYFEHEGELKSVKADTIILSVGLKSRMEEAVALAPDNTKVVFIGDCNKASDVKYAVASAYDTALRI